jgi:hypothetical protein
VQISSWFSSAKAQMQARQFSDAGIRAFVMSTGRKFCVCIGKFASHAAALQRAEELTPMLETKYDIIQLK